MRMKQTTACAALAVGTALLVGCAGMERNERHGERRAFPAAAEQAVMAAFPNAKIEKAKWEREDGVGAFAVDLEQGKQEFEARVSPDGTLIEVETELAAGELPQAVTDALAKSVKGEIKEAAKQEVRAEPKLVTLPATRTIYTVAVVEGHKRGEIEVAADGSVVTPLKWKSHGAEGEKEADADKEGGEAEQPAMNLAELQKVADALQKQMPQAKLGAVGIENEEGLVLYEVELEVGESRVDALVAPDGAIVEVETVVLAKDLPPAVAAAVAHEAPDAKILRVEKQETMAEVRMTPLATPKVFYEVEVKGEREVRVTPEGVIVNKPKGD
jgi:uncharacterized membrane protein YkoI